ncbi:hypothetical protein D3C76_861620 [compost metagenome]
MPAPMSACASAVIPAAIGSGWIRHSTARPSGRWRWTRKMHSAFSSAPVRRRAPCCGAPSTVASTGSVPRWRSRSSATASVVRACWPSPTTRRIATSSGSAWKRVGCSTAVTVAIAGPVSMTACCGTTTRTCTTSWSCPTMGKRSSWWCVSTPFTAASTRDRPGPASSPGKPSACTTCAP